MPNGSPTPGPSFYLKHALKDSIGGRRPANEIPGPENQGLGIIANACNPEFLTSSAPEIDPNGLTAKVPGAKMDSGKVDVMKGAWFYFPRALTQVARVSEAGAKKYSWKGWEKVLDGITRYTAAMGRHIKEDPYSTDNGVGGLGSDYLHASQVAWNALARLELIMRDIENNNAKTT